MSEFDILASYVTSDKARKSIFEDIARQPMDVEGLMRKNRMPESLVERELEALKDRRIVRVRKGVYSLTDQGKKVNGKIRETDAPRSTTVAASRGAPQKLTGAQSRKRRENQGT